MRNFEPRNPPAGRGPAWLWPLALAMLATPVLLIVGFLLWTDAAFLRWVLRAGLGLGLAAGAGAIVVGLRVAWVRLGSRESLLLDHDVARVAAGRLFPDGLQSIHYTDRSKVEASAAEPAWGLDPGDAPMLPAPDPGQGLDPRRPLLQQLLDRGIVARSGNQLHVGNEGGRPVYVDGRQCGLIAIGGEPAVGKTTTAGYLIAQAALMGWGIVLCDRNPANPEGLIRTCEPLSGKVMRQAGSPAEVAATLRWVDEIGRRRAGGEPWQVPVLLVIDEFSNMVIRGELSPADLDLIAAMAMAYRSVGVVVMILGHLWSRQYLGDKYGAGLRQVAAYTLAHRMKPDAAGPLLPGGGYARQVAELGQGVAVLNGRDGVFKVEIPWLKVEDLAFAAGGRPPRPYAPWVPVVLPTPVPPAASSAASAIPPTTPVSAPAPVAVPATVALAADSLETRILDLFSYRPGQWMTAEAVAELLAAEYKAGSVRNQLTRLGRRRKLRARGGGPGRPVEYAGQAAGP